MASVLIVHGALGHPQENWFPWLKKELEQLGVEVFVPQFPTPEKQTLQNWLAVFREYDSRLPADSLFVGHSLGVPFLLNVLEKRKAKAAFLVAGFTGLAGNEFDPCMKTFAQRKFGWQTIKSNCKKFTVYHSLNDPYIKIGKVAELAKNLGVKVTVVENAGHFNEAAGYKEFDLLLEEIKKEL
ncbi:alpha/beta hydrolase [Candidatus Micrarchaeota archaeon]|nr:alpha/beta hydrolase [Candidatus Micrarchaeota archaeon]MBU1939640.1 alpha/beta hydrolase [Candidatus Micrarchaeota archaeon]